jgi:hypothetical protein
MKRSKIEKLTDDVIVALVANCDEDMTADDMRRCLLRLAEKRGLVEYRARC